MLSSYINVFNTCLVVLRNKGYALTYQKETDIWFARQGDFEFQGDNPIELLGLVGIYDQLKPTSDVEYWWKLDEPDVLSELEA